eukprot:1079925-Prymnesium_polylepis.2
MQKVHVAIKLQSWARGHRARRRVRRTELQIREEARARWRRTRMMWRAQWLSRCSDEAMRAHYLIESLADGGSVEELHDARSAPCCGTRPVAGAFSFRCTHNVGALTAPR